MRKTPTDNDERDDQREEEVIGDDDVAEADRHDQVEAKVEGVDEGPVTLPVDEHRGAHRAVEADARDVGADWEPQVLFCVVKKPVAEKAERFELAGSGRYHRRLPSIVLFVLAEEPLAEERLWKEQKRTMRFKDNVGRNKNIVP